MKKPLCIALATSGLLATSLFVGVIASNAEAAPSTTASPSSVIGAHDGTTLTSAADHFARIRTQERSAAKGLDTNTDAAVPDHPAWGVFTSNVPMTGQQAYNSVAAGYTFSSDTLYAPTMKAPNSCIEMVTAYNGGNTPQVWAWDWCDSIDVAKSVNIDSTFIANYTVKKNGLDSYLGKLEQTNASNNTWSAQLFNVRTQKWDTLFTQSGSDQGDTNRSWNIFELYTNGPANTSANYCNAMGTKSFQSTECKLKIDGQWSAPTSSNSSVYKAGQSSFRCDLSQVVQHANDSWIVNKN